MSITGAVTLQWTVFSERHDPIVNVRGSITWRRGDAIYGLLCAIPAALVALGDVPNGLSLAFGVLPATIVGVGPTRRERAAAIVAGTVMGLSILTGSLLAGTPWLAVLTLLALCPAAALLARRRRRAGMLALTLGLPLVGIGFSFSDPADTVGLAVLLALGSVFGWVVALAWPARPAPAATDGPLPDLLGYGVRLGIAGAIAAAIGFAAGWDHVGWACAACILVMRPAPDLVESRGIGRLLSVLAGGSVAVVLSRLTDEGAIYAVAILLALMGASATHSSRWYITSAFSTFLALSLLTYGATSDAAAGRLNERMGETLLGVGLAFVFGTLIPLAQRRRVAAAE